MDEYDVLRPSSGRRWSVPAVTYDTAVAPVHMRRRSWTRPARERPIGLVTVPEPALVRIADHLDRVRAASRGSPREAGDRPGARRQAHRRAPAAAIDARSWAATRRPPGAG
jgi:hypothetical protein